MIINSDLTIYNKKYDPESRMDTWYKTYIPECHWKVDNKVVQDDNGLRNQDTFKIRIPGKYELQAGQITVQIQRFHILGLEASRWHNKKSLW